MYLFQHSSSSVWCACKVCVSGCMHERCAHISVMYVRCVSGVCVSRVMYAKNVCVKNVEREECWMCEESSELLVYV